MKLISVLQGTNVICPKEAETIEITGIAFNSEQVERGNIFVCIKGHKDNGQVYVLDAAFKGASVIISEGKVEAGILPVLITDDARKTLTQLSYNFYANRENKIDLMGVTGTNGKTTVAYMIKEIFEMANRPCGMIGTINYSFADKIYKAINTTPEPCYLQRLFSEMADCQVKDCIMEVSSHSLELGRVDTLKFQYGIFTNLTPEHMDFHKDMEQYFKAKKRLFDMTLKGNIINVDESYGRKIIKEIDDNSEAEIITYSLKDKRADYYCTILNTLPTGSDFYLYEKQEFVGLITINMPGLFMIYDAMAAIACCRANGIEFAKIQRGLKQLKGVPGRFEIVENTKGITAIVDYAHTPDALENLLKTASDFKKGRIICVFGCGGERDKEKRRVMGRVAGEYSDYVIITSDNPRSENPKEIIAEIETGIYDTGCDYEIIEDRYAAIKKAVYLYNKEDMIIVAGKGHETYQLIGKDKTNFDDREIVKEIIGNLQPRQKIKLEDEVV